MKRLNIDAKRRSIAGALLVALATVGLVAPAHATTPLHDAELVVDRVLISGQRATLQVGIWGATAPRDGRYLPGEVTITLLRPSEDRSTSPAGASPVPHRWTLLTRKTLPAQLTTVDFEVPNVSKGSDYLLEIATRSAAGQSTRELSVRVTQRDTALVWLDRTTIEPTDRIRWSVRLWQPASTLPLADFPVTVRLEGPRGVSVPVGSFQTDRFGSVTGETRMPEDAVDGRYRIVAAARGHETPAQFRVATAKFAPNRPRKAPAPVDPMEEPKPRNKRLMPLSSHVIASGAALEVPCPESHDVARVSMLHSGAAVASAACVDGAKTATVTPPAGLFGLVGLRQTAQNRFERQGRLKRDKAWAFVMPQRLKVTLVEGADGLTVQVVDPAGKPVEAASVAASVIDEGLALPWKKTAMEHLLAVDGTIQRLVRGVPLSAWTKTPTAERVRALRRQMAGQNSWPEVAKPRVELPARERLAAELARVRDIRSALKRTLPRRAGAAPGEHSVRALLLEADWKEDALATPWGKHVTWSYLTALDPTLTRDSLAQHVTRTRLELWDRRLHKRPAASRQHFFARKRTDLDPFIGSSGYLRVDGWGHAFVATASDRTVELRAPGKDGQLGTADDVAASISFDGGVGAGGIGSAGSGFS